MGVIAEDIGDGVNVNEENMIDDLENVMKDGYENEDTMPADNPSSCGYFSKSMSPENEEALSEFEEKTSGVVDERNVEGDDGNQIENENDDEDRKQQENVSADLNTSEVMESRVEDDDMKE